jgi:hypothetical protein
MSNFIRIKTALLGLLIILGITSCSKDKENFGPTFENYFSLGLDYYTVNTSNIFWNEELKALNVRSNQGAVILISFNAKPSKNKNYKVVRPDDLDKAPDNCSVTIIGPESNLTYWTSTSADGGIFDLQVKGKRIGVDYANVEMATLDKGNLVKQVSNGKFYSR